MLKNIKAYERQRPSNTKQKWSMGKIFDPKPNNVFLLKGYMKE